MSIRLFVAAACSWVVASSIGTCAIAAKPDQALDISKLKAGDKLEIKKGFDWEPAEFVEIISPQMIRVKRDGQKQAIGYPVAFVRLPAKGKMASSEKKGSAKAEKKGSAKSNPFATEAEQGASATRKWASQDGDFTVEASLVEVVGDKVKLRRNDDKEITVPIEKLSSEDRQYIAKWKARRAIGDSAKADKASDEREVPLTPTDLSEAAEPDLADAKDWRYQSDPEPPGDKLPLTQVALKPTDFHTHASGVLLLPSEKKAFVVFTSRSGSDYKSLVQACTVAGARKVDSAGVFGVGVVPVDISPDGSLVLARTDGFGFGNKKELRVYQREGNKIKPLAAWVPFAGATNKRGSASMASFQDDVHLAAFLDAKHVVTTNLNGNLAVWEVPKIRPVYQLRLAGAPYVAISPGRKYLAVPTEAGIAIVRALSGELVGNLPADMPFHYHALAFRPDGRQLALVQDARRVRVWDLKDRELTRDFSLPNPAGRTIGLQWASDHYLLVNHGTVVDVDCRVEVWNYTHLGDAYQVAGGKIWLTQGGLATQPATLVSTPIPHAAAREVTAKLDPDDLLVVRPGVDVAVELPVGATPEQQASRQGVIDRLKENGMNVVPQSELKLVGTIETGETKAVQYRPFGAARRGTTMSTYQATSQIMKLRFMLGNEELWKYEIKSTPPSIVHMKQGETIEQSIQKAMTLDPTGLQKIWIPSHVARLPGAVGASMSPAN